MEISFRKAALQDLDEVVSLYAAAVRRMNENDIWQWDPSYPNRDVLREDTASGSLIIGRAEGRTVSAVAYNLKSDDITHAARWRYTEANYRIAHRLCVSPDFSGRGAGRRTMLFLEELLRSEGIEDLRLDTVSENEPALGLYRSLGYEVRGTRQYERGTVYFMEKRI